MKLVSDLKRTYNNDNDLIVRKFKSVTIMYLESLCDSISIYEYIIKPVSKNKVTSLDDVIESPKIVKCSKDKIEYFLENGFCIVIFNKEIRACEVKANLDRGINTPLTESSLYGSKDAFCENYQKNLGLLKRRIKSSRLVINTAVCGSTTKTIVSLAYIDGLVSKKYIEDLLKKLDNLKKIEVIDSREPFKEFNRSSIVSTIIKSEKPSVCASFLLKGYAVLLIDNTPFQIIVDVPLLVHINYQTNDVFVKILRYICLFITVLTPAVYIALISFNPETIPIDLLISIFDQRKEVPFPSVIEAILMLLVCEILRESDLRFPSSYGSASSILGALIIGDAAVAAGIVSPIMIIVIALTYITSLIFTEIKLLSQIRIERLALLISATTLGLFGLGIFVIVIINYLCSIDLIEREYL